MGACRPAVSGAWSDAEIAEGGLPSDDDDLP